MIDNFKGVRLKVVKQPVGPSGTPYPNLPNLLGKVGEIEQRWGNHEVVYWCELPYVWWYDSHTHTHGIKLSRQEIREVGTIEYHLRLVWQFLAYKVREVTERF